MSLSNLFLPSDYIGTISMFYGTTLPSGWLLCDGSTITQQDYSDLFLLIGSNLPDLRGGVIVGSGTPPNQSDPSGYPITFMVGDSGGECYHQLNTSEVPPHTHTLSNGDWSESGGGNDFPIPPGSTNTPTYDSFSQTDAHNNMQPYFVANYMIYSGVNTQGAQNVSQI